MAKTKKGAAAIYVVIFTTTLLGVITLSFIRIMTAESLRTTNYSLSQSAYNSALAGVEDAKIVLLRYQNCVSFGNFYYNGGMNADCGKYLATFEDGDAAHSTAKNCNIIGTLLHNTGQNDAETIIRTGDGSSASPSSSSDVIDQAYTCVKVSSFTKDFLAVLDESAPSKIIPLRAGAQGGRNAQENQDSINRIQILWYDRANKDAAGTKNKLGSGTLSSINPGYISGTFGANFGSERQTPPTLQATYIQSDENYYVSDFYSTTSDGKSNRATIMMRPTNSGSVKGPHKVDNSHHSNALGASVYSANKSFNTPNDVYCNLDWADNNNYACAADFTVSGPIRGGSRNRTTNFLILNLPYGGPATNVAVKMYSCSNNNEAITDSNCRLIEFAGVQPMVDSTGRANNLFRRVESRIELADTSFPITSFALAVDGANTGVKKNYYVTKNCNWSTSSWNGSDVTNSSNTCDNAAGVNGE